MKFLKKYRKKDTIMRTALPAKLELQVACRYLATGDSLASLQYLYRVPKCTISKFLPDVPQSESAWDDIINEFEQKWNFPNCIGEIDGKHVVIQCPTNRYWVTIYGSQLDDGIFAKLSLMKAIETNQLKIPAESVIVGDIAELDVLLKMQSNGPLTYLYNLRQYQCSITFRKFLKKYRLINYLEKNKLLSKNQFGFRPGLGTANALYSATSHVYKALDQW
ncbi:protein ALP1-like, partial [Aphis craccivora]